MKLQDYIDKNWEQIDRQIRESLNFDPGPISDDFRAAWLLKNTDRVLWEGCHVEKN